jgi:hypothetical protein
MIDFDVSVTPIEIDIMKLISVLEKSSTGFTVSRVTISNLTLAPGVEAKCALAGEKDVRSHIQVITGQRKFHISSIGAVFSILETQLRAEFTSDGRVAVSPEPSRELRSQLRQFLKACSKK